MRTSLVILAALTAAAATSVFADRQQTLDAALALAEANYPDQLELHVNQPEETHDVILTIKDDPITRIRFSVDSNPADCKAGSACEERLHKAYAQGVAAGVKLKAVNTAMNSCGVRPVAVEGAANTTQFRLVVERDLHAADAQQQLDELTACLSDFRNALPEDATQQQRSIALRIVKPQGGEAASGPLTFEHQWSEEQQNQVSYLLGAGPEETQLSTAQLRLDPTYLASREQRERFSKVARKALKDSDAQAHVPPLSRPWQSQLDPQQPNMLHTHILACSEQQAEDCRPDTAVRLQYDLSKGAVVEQTVLRDVVNEAGWVNLPAY